MKDHWCTFIQPRCVHFRTLKYFSPGTLQTLQTHSLPLITAPLSPHRDISCIMPIRLEHDVATVCLWYWFVATRIMDNSACAMFWFGICCFSPRDVSRRGPKSRISDYKRLSLCVLNLYSRRNSCYILLTSSDWLNIQASQVSRDWCGRWEAVDHPLAHRRMRYQCPAKATLVRLLCLPPPLLYSALGCLTCYWIY